MSSDRISAQKPYSLFSSGRPVVFVDTRNPKAWAESDQKLPKAIRAPLDQLDSHIPEIDRNATVLTYCT